jgi:tetrahydromethanopterin S-methyltransferase subunit G
MMGRMPQTPDEWKDYEADRIIHKAVLSKAEIDKTHSSKQVMDRWVDYVRSEGTQPTGADHD